MKAPTRGSLSAPAGGEDRKRSIQLKCISIGMQESRVLMCVLELMILSEEREERREESGTQLKQV